MRVIKRRPFRGADYYKAIYQIRRLQYLQAWHEGILLEAFNALLPIFKAETSKGRFVSLP